MITKERNELEVLNHSLRNGAMKIEENFREIEKTLKEMNKELENYEKELKSGEVWQTITEKATDLQR